MCGGSRGAFHKGALLYRLIPKNTMCWGVHTPDWGAARKMQNIEACTGRVLGNHPTLPPAILRSMPEQNLVQVWGWASVVGESWTFELYLLNWYKDVFLRPREAIAGGQALPPTPKAVCCSLPFTVERNSERNSIAKHFPNSEACTDCWCRWFPGDSQESLVSLYQWLSTLFGCDCRKENIL